MSIRFINYSRILIWLLLILPGNTYSQIRRDAIWCFGDSVQLDFNQTPPVISKCAIKTRGTAVSITDSTGQLLFYGQTYYMPTRPITRRGVIFNSQHNVMENGDSLTGSGWYHEMQIIPNPANANQYYLFHSGMSVDVELYYSIIDMSYNGGLGKVIQKNILLNDLNGELGGDCLTAIKHGNGRDWWLIYKSLWNYNNNFHRYLITELGISGEMVQSIGQIIESGFTNLIFNSDSSKMVLNCGSGLIEYYDFDRCTGLFSNSRLIHSQTSTQRDFFWSGAISPNDSVLYISSSDTLSFLYQFDLSATNIGATQQLIYSFNIPPRTGGDLHTAPDGKIYWSISYYDGIHFNFPFPDSLYNVYNTNLSVINEPNRLGSACNFQPYSFYLGGYRTYLGLSINPNYDLGPVAGSFCDSLTNDIVSLMKNNFFSVGPNPANESLTIFNVTTNDQFYSVELIDLTGRIVYSKLLSNNIIRTDNIQNGSYILRILQNGNPIQMVKVEIVH